MASQENLFLNQEENSLEKDKAKHALEQLFSLARKYRTGKAFFELIKFVTHFRFYSPFNAMLVHVQMPHARFATSAQRWASRYGYVIKPSARPLVILQPMGPVMFVFDVSDVEPGPHALPLPPDVTMPFEVRGGHIGKELDLLFENCKRDRIEIDLKKEGAPSAGSIKLVEIGKYKPQNVYKGKDQDGRAVFVKIPVQYWMIVNEGMSRESQFVTVLHELAHLYCGHLGTPNPKWWPDRQGLSHEIREVEAESVAHLVSGRLGIDNASEKYLSGFINSEKDIPEISFDCMLKAAGLIEQMCRKKLKPR